MKRVLSVSLGSSRRDKKVVVELLGETIEVERRGTDGSLARFRDAMVEADGAVDALCVGGTNLALHWRGRGYGLRSSLRLTAGVKRTPVVDGSGVKDTLEPEALRWVLQQGLTDLAQAKVLVVAGVDRFGVAEELRRQKAATVVFGDLMFDVGLPIALSFRAIDILAPLCLPLVGWLPFSWLYPTGHSQDEIRPRWQKWYQWADLIVGDFLIIRRHLPNQLGGKVILTNSTTDEDMHLLRERGVRAVVTTSLRVEGRSFGTNVLEGILTVLAGRPRDELGPEDFVDLARQIGWQPDLVVLNECNSTDSPS